MTVLVYFTFNIRLIPSSSTLNSDVYLYIAFERAWSADYKMVR
jgi:hypothetical protein